MQTRPSLILSTMRIFGLTRMLEKLGMRHGDQPIIGDPDSGPELDVASAGYRVEVLNEFVARACLFRQVVRAGGVSEHKDLASRTARTKGHAVQQFSGENIILEKGRPTVWAGRSTCATTVQLLMNGRLESVNTTHCR